MWTSGEKEKSAEYIPFKAKITIPSGFSHQERFQVKNPPSAYIQKLKSVLEQGGGRKVQILYMFEPVYVCVCLNLSVRYRACPVIIKLKYVNDFN